MRRPGQRRAWGVTTLIMTTCLGGPTRAAGQETLSLERLRLSSPPALALLGRSAASVVRPSTPRELIASLVSAAGSDGVLPDGVAIETTPFWLARRREITVEQFQRPGLIDRLRFFTAFSAATARARRGGGEADDRADTYAAIALRTLLATGRANPVLRAAADTMRLRQTDYAEKYRQWEITSARAEKLHEDRALLRVQEDLLSTLVTRVTAGGQTALRDSALRTLARRDSLRALTRAGEAAAEAADTLAVSLDRLEDRLATLAKRFAREELEPDGFILELAAGTQAVFERSEWRRQRVDGAAFWITPMYRLRSSGLELTGIVRHRTNVRDYRSRNVTDIGARTGVDVGRGSFSAERVWRRISGDAELLPALPAEAGRERSTRWSVVFNYPLAPRVWAVAGFGSDYELTGGERPVIATIGIDVGIGAIEIRPSRR